MIYIDATGELGPGPNHAGCELLDAWAADEELTALQDFLERGETQDPKALAAELEAADTPNVAINEMVVALEGAANWAQDFLLLSED